MKVNSRQHNQVGKIVFSHGQFAQCRALIETSAPCFINLKLVVAMDVLMTIKKHKYKILFFFYQGRLFSYHDTHLHRLGTNYLQLPVNCPYRTRVTNYQRDGPQTFDNQGNINKMFMYMYIAHYMIMHKNELLLNLIVATLIKLNG